MILGVRGHIIHTALTLYRIGGLVGPKPAHAVSLKTRMRYAVSLFVDARVTRVVYVV